MGQGARDESVVNEKLAGEQAATLYKSGEAKWGTDEDAFIQVLSHLGQKQANLVFDEYKKISKKSIDQALKSEFSGDLYRGISAIGAHYSSFFLYSFFTEKKKTQQKN